MEILEKQEHYVWIACEDGWRRVIGYSLSLNFMECKATFSLDPQTNHIWLVISEARSGISLVRFPEIKWADIKDSDSRVECILQLLEQNLGLSEYLCQSELQIQLKQLARKYEQSFGPMPD